MSTEPFIGEIKTFGFYFAPRGYMTCQGQLLPIAAYTALFSLLGTTYGGNGQTTFGLPDLQGRMPIGQGAGGGLPEYTIGEEAGAVSVNLAVTNLPAHVHAGQGISVNIPVSTGGGDQTSPAAGYIANQGTDIYSSVSSPGSFLGASQVGGTTSVTGSGFPVSIANPYLVLNYSIAVEGIFPSRN